MATRHRALKGTLLLTGGQVISFACRFVRNIIVVRLLSKEDYGVAATFALTMATLEQITNLSVDKVIVQSKEDIAPRFLATAHTLQLARGVIMALALWTIAWPISSLFNVPYALWAFQWLAIIPLIRGFSHLDISWLQRDVILWPKVATETVPQLFVTAIAWPLTRWIQDYSALLWLLMINYAMTAVATHLVARHPYRLGLERNHLRRILVFTWPLLLSGFLTFTILQGDRFVVGVAYTIEDLAVYSLAMSLVLAPMGMILQIASTIMLPVLARVQDVRVEFERRWVVCNQVIVLMATVFGAGLILSGTWVVTSLYGEKYAAAAVVVAWLAASQAFRLIRAGLFVGAVAQGDTKIVLTATVFRVSGVILALISAWFELGLSWIAIAGLIGEAPAILITAFRLSSTHGIRMRVSLTPSVLLVAVFSVSWPLQLYVLEGADNVVVAGVTLSVILATVAAALAIFTDLRRETMAALSELGSRYHSRKTVSGDPLT